MITGSTFYVTTGSWYTFDMLDRGLTGRMSTMVWNNPVSYNANYREAINVAKSRETDQNEVNIYLQLNNITEPKEEVKKEAGKAFSRIGQAEDFIKKILPGCYIVPFFIIFWYRI